MTEYTLLNYFNREISIILVFCVLLCVNKHRKIIPFCSVFFFRSGRGDVAAVIPILYKGLLGYWGQFQFTRWVAGPLLMAEAATQVPTAHQEQFWGSLVGITSPPAPPSNM